MNKAVYIVFIVAALLSCDNAYDTLLPDENVKSVRGNTYVAKSVLSTKQPGLYLVYHFGNDSTIYIQEASGSISGTVQLEYSGYFYYNHPELKLKIQSICDDCFNYFTATVSDDCKSFSYEIYDAAENKTKTLIFTIE